jgi:hypothetical protein
VPDAAEGSDAAAASGDKGPATGHPAPATGAPTPVSGSPIFEFSGNVHSASASDADILRTGHYLLLSDNQVKVMLGCSLV